MRTCLRAKFPANREINREFCKSGPSPHFGAQSASEFNGFQPNFPIQRNSEFFQQNREIFHVNRDRPKRRRACKPFSGCPAGAS
jgi:hypothetical protein